MAVRLYTSVFQSPFQAVSIPNVSLPDYIFERTAQYGDRVAIENHTTGRRLTYHEVCAHATALAGALQRRGLQKGDVVALCAPNVPEFAPIMLGIAMAGGVVTTINPTYSARELTHLLTNSGAHTMICIPSTLPTLAAAGVALREVVVLGEGPGATPLASLLAERAPYRPVRIDPKVDLLAMPYSSGTTSLPKGVRLTHHNVLANIIQINQPQFFDVTPADSILGILPFFHIYGMAVVLLSSLSNGTRIVTLPRFEPEAFLTALAAHRINLAYLAPPLILFLAKHPAVSQYDLSSLRDIISGAAPLGQELAEAAAKRLGCVLRQGFGMTELSPVSFLMPLGGSSKYASVGKLVPNMELKVADPDTGGPVAREAWGELRLKGPNVMLGYHNNPEADREAFDDEGYLRTGDVGYVDADGDCFLVDRCKELIKVRGFQVAPAELEDVLQTHPAVADCGVIGIPMADGEAPKAFVALKPGHAPSPTLQQELIDFAAQHTAPFKRLRAVAFVPQVPKTPAGKILRRELRDIHRSEAP
eukprot:EG_transcript_6218